VGLRHQRGPSNEARPTSSITDPSRSPPEPAAPQGR
jgi:hypothetical protein